MNKNHLSCQTGSGNPRDVTFHGCEFDDGSLSYMVVGESTAAAFIASSDSFALPSNLGGKSGTRTVIHTDQINTDQKKRKAFRTVATVFRGIIRILPVVLSELMSAAAFRDCLPYTWL